jgi:hypothetical protein
VTAEPHFMPGQAQRLYSLVISLRIPRPSRWCKAHVYQCTLSLGNDLRRGTKELRLSLFSAALDRAGDVLLTSAAKAPANGPMWLWYSLQQTEVRSVGSIFDSGADSFSQTTALQYASTDIFGLTQTIARCNAVALVQCLLVD